MELYFKKLYTIAFRLTGDEKLAEEMAESAITRTMEKHNYNYKVTPNMLQLTILELMKIFLKAPKPCCNNNLKGIQRELLKLTPINRVVVIWRDVLGYKLSDNVPVDDYSSKELLRALAIGRRELKEYVNLQNEKDYRKAI
jgi:DNA-directed RNA polymerase specialized sigma24 family protein